MIHWTSLLGSPVGSAHQMQKKPECIIFPCSPTLLCSRSLLNSIIPGFDIIKFIILSLYTQPSLLFYSASGVSLRYVSFSLSSRCLGESLNRLSPAQVVWLLNCVSASRVLHDSWVILLLTFLHLILLLIFSAAHNHSPHALTILLPFLPMCSYPGSTRLDEFRPHSRVFRASVPWLTRGPQISFLSIFAWWTSIFKA